MHHVSQKAAKSMEVGHEVDAGLSQGTNVDGMQSFVRIDPDKPSQEEEEEEVDEGQEEGSSAAAPFKPMADDAPMPPIPPRPHRVGEVARQVDARESACAWVGGCNSST